MVHRIHTSEVRSYLACRRRWDWHYRQRYLPVKPIKYLEFGIAYHKAMETFHNPARWDYPIDTKLGLALTIFVHACEQQKAEYAEHIGGLDSEAEEDYAERIELGKGMLQYYAYTVFPQQMHAYKPFMVEIPFTVPVTVNGEVLQCPYLDGSCGQDHEGDNSIVYGGRVDMLVEDIENGGYWVWDWKTAKTLLGDQQEKFLYLDPQVGSYPWALRIELGLDIRGFIYYEQRKEFPHTPKELTRQREGCWYSKNKIQITDFTTYRNYVEQNDPDAFNAGLYDDFLTYLKDGGGTEFYKIHRIIKNDNELFNIGHNISRIALEMTNPHLFIYPAPGRFTCATCAYFDPCMGKNREDDYQYGLDTMYELGDPYAYAKPSSDKQ